MKSVSGKDLARLLEKHGWELKRINGSHHYGAADFCRAKVATVRFYSEHILPQAAALSSEVVGSAGSVLVLSEAQF